MTHLLRLFVVAMLPFFAACAAQPQIHGLGQAELVSHHQIAQQAISEERWLDAYIALERVLSSSRTEEVASAVAVAARHPEVLQAADAVFEESEIHKLMALRGKNVGRDLMTIRLQPYFHVATRSGYERAHQSIQRAYANFEDVEGVKRAAEAKRIEALRRSYLASTSQAAERAKFLCRDTLECNKAFSLAQIYVSETATMKIQTANDTIIQTFNPSGVRSIGMKVVKFPRSGTTAEITLTITCQTSTEVESTKFSIDLLETCAKAVVGMYDGFVPYLRQNLQK